MNTTILSESEQSAKNLTFIIYILYAVAWFNGITAIIAIIINYVKKDDVQNTFLENHFRWQIRTFWFGLLWIGLGAITTFIFIGWVILFINTIWMIYRIVKGMLYLNENKTMYES